MNLIYNGLDTDFRDPKQVSAQDIQSWRKQYGRGKKHVVLYYGHAGKSKGIDYLIEAIPDILQKWEDVIIVCNVIESKRSEIIREKVKGERGKSDSVQVYSGFSMEELRVLVASADVVVAPSISEGFGYVHAETCAMNIPLVTTHTASIPEVVSGKVVFIDPGSSEEVVSGIEKMRSNQYQELEKKKFSWDECVENIEKLY